MEEEDMDGLNFIIPTYNENSETYIKRHEVSIDNYARFKWRGVDSYEAFGCFITNNRNLKWVNYANFNDEFTNPMFSSAPAYLGTSFQQKSLQLTLGVYWITAADYRKLVNWLSPEVVGKFEYGYGVGWQYNVKINKFTETTYYSIGCNENGEEVYYAEATITLVTVADNSVTSVNPWDIQMVYDAATQATASSMRIYFVDNDDKSELNTDLYISLNLTLYPQHYYELMLCQIDESITEATGEDMLTLASSNESILFTFTVNNITGRVNNVVVEYESQKGKMYFNNKLVSDLLTIDNKEVISSYVVNKNFLPGILHNAVLNREITITQDGRGFVAGQKFKPIFLKLSIKDAELQPSFRGLTDEPDVAVFPKRSI